MHFMVSLRLQRHGTETVPYEKYKTKFHVRGRRAEDMTVRPRGDGTPGSIMIKTGLKSPEKTFRFQITNNK